MKRALVLEGGGAKGAYAVGCLRGLQENGVKFDVVAGTSVGALNAALIGTGRLNDGDTLWKSLSFDHVCEPSRRLSTWLLLPFHLVSMFLHRIPFFGSLPFASRQPPRDGYLGITVFVGVPLLFVWLLFAGSIWFLDDKKGLAVHTLLLTSVMVLLGSLWAIPYAIRQSNRSIFTVGPLRAEIARLLSGAEFSLPTYATLAERRVMFDPDQPGFYHIGGQFGYIRGAMEQEEYVPHYVRLDELSASDRVEVLTASAAIPFGVFPAVTIGGCEYIDGGVADNIPLVPIIELHDCEEIYVIRLRPHIPEELISHWQLVDRRLRVAEMDVGKCKSMYYAAMKERRIQRTVDEAIDPPENVPVREFPIENRRLVVLAPQNSLGTFLRGTMNFDRDYAQKLLAQGYRDACSIVGNPKSVA